MDLQSVTPPVRSEGTLKLLYVLTRLRYGQTFDVQGHEWEKEAINIKAMVVNAVRKLDPDST